MNKYEAEFSNLVKAFRKRHMGKGPREIRTTFCNNWAICEMQGNLSPVEKFIAGRDDGKQVIREARTEMVKEMYRDHHPHELEALLGASFVSLFVDIDIDRDVGMSIFVFDQNLEHKFGSGSRQQQV
ncbi:hypothetical protein BG53_05495 [Paenibacillus darwinianus]|uniref:Na+-translocating membrane potential-generating system MpsC domain-containing protein n=1 Tax=Paenibacillus darwinianus TaxID=1380763 RepID=A0A9W5W6H2_9BACL|nr:DUF2294 domain-containing protein [Paenibacillus darwinianus]EXX85026.1 hypothetical protein BG52_09330 [Paenibacillus darwinianus]EXX86699.1 hypothetical protein BG53_05495 [Paenibacillus darwinianus]EXX88913.1 hypothetical protein CH50_02570 [Paenibacillus darwinianus]